MAASLAGDRLAEDLAELIRQDFRPRFDRPAGRFPDSPRWQALRETGSELWLDTGDMDAIGRLWARQLSAVTTNNTLLNEQVQTGQYDDLIKRAAALIRDRTGRPVDDPGTVLEIAFVLNTRHALRLVEAFDAYVSVEEHTDLAHDIDGALAYARRIYALCPERFLVKIPLTPAGLIAARRCHEERIPVNLTLGFSARQNYLAARVARPRFVNVFLGRLNSFVRDNRLGTGELVGERATMASQRAVRDLRLGSRPETRLETRQIAASVRSGEQLPLLAGVDVITMPTRAAREFLTLEAPALADRTGEEYRVALTPGVDPREVALDTLWDVPDALVRACDALDRREPASLTPGAIAAALREHGVGDLLVHWEPAQIRTSRQEGKIPRLERWHEGLKAGRFGLDAVMTLAGLGSFAADQAAMDERVRRVLGA